MDSARLKIESEFLQRVAAYRQEYRDSRSAALNEERERRHADGEVYLAGCWVPRREAGRVIRAFQQRELATFFEIVALLALSLGIAVGLCQLFAFLFMP